MPGGTFYLSETSGFLRPMAEVCTRLLKMPQGDTRIWSRLPLRYPSSRAHGSPEDFIADRTYAEISEMRVTRRWCRTREANQRVIRLEDTKSPIVIHMRQAVR